MLQLTWALDLDGVVWLAGQAIRGSAEAVALLRGSGERVVFLTNNSGPLLREHLAALAAIDIEAQEEDLVTSAQAAALLLAPGSKAMVIGDPGVHEALANRGVEVVPYEGEPEAVVVGRTVSLDYWALSSAATAVRHGARFIATNTDSTFPTREGLVPGAGAIVAFIATAAGSGPEVAGKPNAAMAELVASRYGRLEVVVGDRADTDGLFARRVGARFGLVLSGVTKANGLPVEPAPDMVSTDLRALVREHLRKVRL
ncbi:MAG: HAD-IIA family hydrolase [Acidimicrobiales bacterium]